MTDKKMMREEIDKLKQELQNRDALEQELRQKHEEAMNAIAKLNARLTSTELGGTPKPTLSMEEIVTTVKQEVQKASNADGNADSEDSGDESDSSYIGALNLTIMTPMNSRPPTPDSSNGTSSVV